MTAGTQKLLAQQEPPGPRPTFPGQHLMALMTSPLDFLTRAARWGDVVRLSTGRRETYLLCHPDAIRDVLVTHHRQFVKSPVLQRMRSFLGVGLLTSEGDLHLRQRRLIQPAFHKQRINSYAQIISEAAERIANHWQKGVTLDVHNEMMRLTMVIVGRALFGVDVESEAAEIGEAITTLQGGTRRLLLPFWERIQTLPLPGNRKLLQAGLKVDGAVRRMIAARRAAAAANSENEAPALPLAADLMDMLLHARDEQGDGQGMSDELVRDEVMTLFLAGHETTANALTWTLYLLSQHPEVEARLHAELDQVLGRRAPQAADWEKLTYTRQVLAESMRIFPPVWVIGRQLISDYEVGGYRLPAGATVMMSQWVVHHDPRWHPDPFTFDPNRWSKDRQEGQPRFAYFPFGGGPRVCVGEPFAWMEGVLVLAALARRWKLRLAPGQKVATLPQITLRPRYGMKMEISER